MADPNFWKTGGIYVILGVELFLPLFRVGQVADEDLLPIAQNSVLGWLVAGRFAGGISIQTLCTVLTIESNVNIDKSLRMFWEAEKMPLQKVITADACHRKDISSES